MRHYPQHSCGDGVVRGPMDSHVPSPCQQLQLNTSVMIPGGGPGAVLQQMHAIKQVPLGSRFYGLHADLQYSHDISIMHS
jgi:hypothetical protein